jgi:DNA polymerase-3 subunit gamma/tau
VVFVLATTDPQKVSDTIRSRTQHLQFRLLAAKELEDHVRWVVQDAKLEVSADAIRQVVEQGAGSARDTLSALELVVAGGGEAEVFVRPEDVIESLITHDAAAVLTQVGAAMQRGHDPKAFTEQIVRFLREMFLSSMAPQLVQLADDHAKVAADMTARYGVASVVRAIEVLGEALVDIRRAPDPRLVLEVTLVRLASNVITNDTASLLARVERLESGASHPRDVTGPIPRPRLTSNTQPSPAASGTSSRPATRSSTQPSTQPSAPVAPTPTVGVLATDDVVGAWPSVVRTLKATVRALYSAVDVVGIEGDTLVVSAPSEMHKKKCLELKDHVCTALTAAAGRPINVDVRVQASRVAGAASTAASPTAAATKGNATPTKTHSQSNSVDDIDDINDITDEDSDVALAESVVDHIAKQFPGARIVDNTKK